MDLAVPGDGYRHQLARHGEQKQDGQLRGVPVDGYVGARGNGDQYGEPGGRDPGYVELRPSARQIVIPMDKAPTGVGSACPVVAVLSASGPSAFSCPQARSIG